MAIKKQMKKIKNLKEKVKLLSTLIEITTEINANLNLKEVLKNIMKAAKNLMKAERTSLFLLEKETNELIFEIALGEQEKEGKIKQVRLKIGEGVVGYVVKSKKPLLISCVSKDKRWSDKVDKETGFATKSIICIPLKSKGQVIGAIEAVNKKNGVFVKEDIKTFTALSTQAEIALNNAKLYEEIENLFLGTVKALSAAIDAKDRYTQGHSERVAKISLLIASSLHLKKEQKNRLQLCALLHDIGKIGIPGAILQKPTSLTKGEWEKIKQHSIIGAEIIKPIHQLQDIILPIKHHHEKFDGTGYPDKLKNKEIPLLSRIIALADAIDAMTSQRIYRKAFIPKETIKEIKKCSGTQFDAKIVQAFLKGYEKHHTFISILQRKNKNHKNFLNEI